MKCIIFFIILISLIYLNYNLKYNEHFDDKCINDINSLTCTVWEGDQCNKVRGENGLGTCSNFDFNVENQRTKCLKYCKTHSTVETKFIDDNKLAMARLHNIPIDNQNLNPYIDTGNLCVSKNDCEDGNICGNDNGNCQGCDNKKCYKIIDTNMYNLDSGNPSSIELFDVDSLFVTFKFRAILSLKNNNQMLVLSGSNEWYIYINESGEIMLNGKNIDEQRINSDLTNTDDDNIYTFIIIVTNDYINIDVNGKQKEYPLKIDEQSYDSSESKKIYFGGSPNHDLGIEYFNGYIGGFFIEDKYNKLCTFRYNKDGIKKDCLSECKKAACNKLDCEDICKDIKECNFDSSVNVSRHSIDCMTKCINPSNQCDVNYCKKQCWNCDKDCYWVKNNKFSDEYDDKSGKPIPAKISLHNTSYDGTKATIVWQPPNKGNLNLPIDGYFSIAYKTSKKSEGLKIDKIDSGICEKYCKYVISNLIPEEDYSLVVKAYNSVGIGKSSNLLQFKTTKKLINTAILNKIEDVSQYEVGNYTKDNFCNI
jgi:hypothetical protein